MIYPFFSIKKTEQDNTLEFQIKLGIKWITYRESCLILKNFLVSSACHLLIFSLIFIFSGNHQKGLEKSIHIHLLNSQAQAGVIPLSSNTTPFQGVSLSSLLSQPKASSKLAELNHWIRKLDLKPLTGAPMSLPQIQVNLNSTIKETVFSPQESVKIQKIMSTIKPKLSQAYGEALKLDPSLTLRVSYEATVNPQGALTEIRFYFPDINQKGNAASYLEKKMGQLFAQLKFGQEYVGHKIQGEQVFIH